MENNDVFMGVLEDRGRADPRDILGLWVVVMALVLISGGLANYQLGYDGERSENHLIVGFIILPALFLIAELYYLANNLTRLSSRELERLSNFNFNEAGQSMMTKYISEVGVTGLRSIHVRRALVAHKKSEQRQTKARSNEYERERVRTYSQKIAEKFSLPTQ